MAAAASALGGAITRNPLAAGGSAALLVATVYVAANALWYQPHAHRGAFFATRDFVRAAIGTPETREPETTFVIERPAQPAPAPVSDPTIAKVQEILASLKFYDGKVDGLSGPATARAIARYRGTVGLSASGGVDGDLLVQLGLQPTTAGIAPAPAPRPKASADGGEVDRTALIRKVQAGLKEFGNSGIEIDGVAGPRTKTAVREFQSFFGLTATGEPDEALLAKMREIGVFD
jgi:peptidoglycan hydrolase-like protein with peptidoglycan-binding domain